MPGYVTQGFCYFENVEVEYFCLFVFCLSFDNGFNPGLQAFL